METAFTEIEGEKISIFDEERKKNPRERKRDREHKSRKRRAARHSCHDGPRSSIFRAEIKWKNERTPSLEYPLGARHKT